MFLKFFNKVTQVAAAAAAVAPVLVGGRREYIDVVKRHQCLSVSKFVCDTQSCVCSDA